MIVSVILLERKYPLFLVGEKNICPASATHFTGVFVIVFWMLKNVGITSPKQQLILFSEKKVSSVKVEE